jgi:hypothetical protein
MYHLHSYATSVLFRSVPFCTLLFLALPFQRATSATFFGTLGTNSIFSTIRSSAKPPEANGLVKATLAAFGAPTVGVFAIFSFGVTTAIVQGTSTKLGTVSSKTTSMRSLHDISRSIIDNTILSRDDCKSGNDSHNDDRTNFLAEHGREDMDFTGMKRLRFRATKAACAKDVVVWE